MPDYNLMTSRAHTISSQSKEDGKGLCVTRNEGQNVCDR